ncbi:hypothetical protein MOQ72_22825 [Saccharopolyspora sp. K220]|uniref:hypothetical protein n=1 Tax=Saccharopolyspora soli TaxID=2926618 RepID=UPI001F5A7C8F|nr:hypothetical protein [Saccharopolyspora soli]MCI2420282.1 hypothetical protein [Saccharopolyspora soli]
MTAKAAANPLCHSRSRARANTSDVLERHRRSTARQAAMKILVLNGHYSVGVDARSDDAQVYCMKHQMCPRVANVLTTAIYAEIPQPITVFDTAVRAAPACNASGPHPSTASREDGR